MMLSVCKRFHFDSAHKLPNYKGKCKNLHGHRWEVEVEVSGEVNPKTGMILDFSLLKAFCEKTFLNQFDHGYLNEHLENPTAENLVEFIVKIIQVVLKEEPYRLERIRLYESPDAYAEWRAE